MITSLPLDHIDRRSDARALDEGTVNGLVESIGNVGLINAIRVRADGGRYELIAGAHRHEACRRLGLVDIDCIVVMDDDLHAELAMIDENLMRAELKPAERAAQTARRKAIYIEMHPETAAGVAGADARWNATDNLSTASFAADTAKAIGKDERTVRRDAERGEKVIPEALELIRDTALDKGSYLDRIKRLSPSEQMHAVKRDLAFERSKERDKEATRRQAKINADVKACAAREVAEMLAHHVPAEWWDGLKANLYAAGASNIANELVNIVGDALEAAE